MGRDRDTYSLWYSLCKSLTTTVLRFLSFCSSVLLSFALCELNASLVPHGLGRGNVRLSKAHHLIKFISPGRAKALFLTEGYFCGKFHLSPVSSFCQRAILKNVLISFDIRGLVFPTLLTLPNSSNTCVQIFNKYIKCTLGQRPSIYGGCPLDLSTGDRTRIFRVNKQHLLQLELNCQASVAAHILCA